jgi:hypothetical protein
MHLGYYDEALAWRDWVIRAVAGSPEQVQILYGVGPANVCRSFWMCLNWSVPARVRLE